MGSRGASDAPEGIRALPSASATDALPTLEKVVKHAMWAIAVLAPHPAADAGASLSHGRGGGSLGRL